MSDVVDKISIAEYSFDLKIAASSSIKDLIKRLLCPDPQLRLTAADAL